MGRFAVIDSGNVSNIIVADTKEIAEQATGKVCIEYTENDIVHIGMKWDETNGFEQPVVEETPVADNTQDNHHRVIIGGKEKKMAKNSAYLMDMITLEE